MKKNDKQKEVIYSSWNEELEKFDRKEKVRCKGLKWGKDFFDKLLKCNKRVFMILVVLVGLLAFALKANAATFEDFNTVKTQIQNSVVPQKPINCDGSQSNLNKKEYEQLKEHFHELKVDLNMYGKIEIEVMNDDSLKSMLNDYTKTNEGIRELCVSKFWLKIINKEKK